MEYNSNYWKYEEYRRVNGYKSRTALDVAKYVIDKCSTEGHPISNLHLQKVLYCLQREFLQKYGYPLFDDDFEAWQF